MRPARIEHATSSRPSKRFHALDGLRGLAALSVVLYHYTYLFQQNYRPRESLNVQLSFGHYGVQLFFLISGYVIFMSARCSRSVKHFAFNRFLRIYPTYFVALTLAVIWGSITTVPGLQTTPLQVLVNYTMLARVLRVRQVDGVYWSLVVEIFFYILVGILLWRFGRLTRRITAYACVIWLCIGTVTSILQASSGSRIAQLVNLIAVGQYCGLFVAGIALFLVREDGAAMRWLAVAGAVQASFAEILLVGLTGGLVVALICIAFATVAYLPDAGPLTWGAFTWLGGISYPLYLVHQNLGYMLLSNLYPTVGAVLATVLVLMAALLLAWLVHELVEIRLTRWLKPRLAAVVRL